MKLSEVTTENVKKALRIDYDYDDDYITSVMASAKSYIASKTSLTFEELDEYPEFVHAFYCVCADMYQNRETTVQNGRENPTVEAIIAMHRRNYI